MINRIRFQGGASDHAEDKSGWFEILYVKDVMEV
jgi:hypothetical protein